MLARLDSIRGVVRSFANRAGTLVRITVAPDAKTDEVLEDVLAVLREEGGEDLSRLSGAELNRAIDGEEWRDSTRIAELSAIEFRTLVLRGLAVLLPVGLLIAWFVRRRRRRARLKSS